ncbi:MAG: DUF4340 domain-containing protein [Bacteroidia bacterium]
MFLVGCKTNRTEVASDRQLLKLDSSSFDSWEIVPGKNADSDAYRMIRKNNKWMISVKGNEPAEPDTAYLRRSLQHITNLQAVTELNIPQKNWDTLQLTDKDTRLIVYKDGKPVKEIILGKMFFSKANKTTYYVRLKDENEIYTVQQYLEGSFKVPAQKLRKKEMVNVAPSQIANIIFLKPEGIDFTLLRAGQQAWSIDGILTTDAIANKYVAALTNLQIANFAETPNIGAILSIEITTYDGKEISLRAFRKNSESWIMSSSANQGNYMELKDNEIQTLFPGKEYFMQSQAK